MICLVIVALTQLVYSVNAYVSVERREDILNTNSYAVCNRGKITYFSARRYWMLRSQIQLFRNAALYIVAFQSAYEKFKMNFQPEVLLKASGSKEAEFAIFNTF